MPKSDEYRTVVFLIACISLLLFSSIVGETIEGVYEAQYQTMACQALEDA